MPLPSDDLPTTVIHRRTEIRQQAARLLRQAVGDLPVTVCQDFDTQPDQLPAIMLDTGDDQLVTVLSTQPLQQRMEIQLFIVAMVAGNNTAAMSTTKDQLDALCLIVESAIDGTLGDIAEKVELSSVTSEPMLMADTEIQAALHSYKVTWVHTVHALSTDPALLPLFEQVTLNWDLTTSDGQLEATDTLTYT